MNMNQLASSRSLCLTVPFALFLASFTIAGSSSAQTAGGQPQNGYVPPQVPGVQQQQVTRGSGLFGSKLPRYSSGNRSQYGNQATRTYPAYNQIQSPTPQQTSSVPAPTPAPAVAQPTIPGQLTGPVAYPKLDEPAPAAPKPTTTNPQTDIASELVDLRKSERTLDQRLSNLEKVAQPTAQPSHSLIPAGTPAQITYVPHQVAPRETIWGIADRYGVSAEDIRRTNKGTDFISTGDILYIPQRVVPQMALMPEPAAPRQVSMQSKSADPIHIVKQGDTITGIAAKYHVSARAIQTMNGVKNPKTLSIGRKLIIPGGASVAPKMESEAPPARKASPKAADQHFVTKDTSKPSKAEHPKDLPQVVKAPESPAPKALTSEPPSRRAIMSYRIEANDDIDSVAKSFRTTSAEIRRLNRIDKLPAKDGVIVVPVPGSGTL